MVGHSLLHRGEQLLALPHDLDAYARTGAATGIPFLHPWANRLGAFRYVAAGQAATLDPDAGLVRLDDHGLPIHGVLGGRPGWDVRDAGADHEAAWLQTEFHFGNDPELLDAFPYPHTVRTDVRLHAATLTIATSVIPTADAPVPISFGYHPYLRLPSIERARWEVAMPGRERLGLDERGLPAGGREPLAAEHGPLGARTFDDLFAVGDRPVRFAVAGGGREVTVELRAGYPYAQVFAPRGQDLICFEPMTAPVNALISGAGLRLVEPGDTFRAEFSVSVR